MYSMEDLKRMQNVDLRTIKLEDVTDISQVRIDTGKPVPERVKAYVEQVKNPYLVRIGEYIVKIGYSDCKETLNDRMKLKE